MNRPSWLADSNRNGTIRDSATLYRRDSTRCELSRGRNSDTPARQQFVFPSHGYSQRHQLDSITVTNKVVITVINWVVILPSTEHSHDFHQLGRAMSVVRWMAIIVNSTKPLLSSTRSIHYCHQLQPLQSSTGYTHYQQLHTVIIANNNVCTSEYHMSTAWQSMLCWQGTHLTYWWSVRWSDKPLLGTRSESTFTITVHAHATVKPIQPLAQTEMFSGQPDIGVNWGAKFIWTMRQKSTNSIGQSWHSHDLRRKHSVQSLQINFSLLHL
jgi:hypothetical protein